MGVRDVVWQAKAVVFDLDDTLLITRVVKWAHHQAVAARFYGIELSEDELREHWGKPYDQLIGLLYRHSAPLDEMKAANLSLEHLYRKTAATGALDLVQALLDNGTHVGVVTSANTDPAITDLHHAGFSADRLAFVHGADRTTKHKPDPEVFAEARRILAKSGVRDADTVYIGDALMDLHAARGAGFGFVGVGPEFEVEGVQWVRDLGELR
ncbi:HAD family hydrolase [Actinokineospora diospyrosa]|uniref:Haloacid dehalogenase superfamily, subfamily IA, variant 1 with third motif having Dx(3-4)D or Dx(3-4)E n=1 Tax=Actinokineospora diospyrosa TaxID=103728 RepID=A0ABT1IM47_9PSEU|nr:HAD-IA family hydrolase [Actinokineospora diospyrosa]MCP2273588.1 haloacid dehalogenase superfamily, subfamily IA, variant 1 with third motif having Dx(3-4)D or Dx(3-4)E [Actinokineospora diospyrosa]